MKSVQFIYQDTEIHFLVNPDQENVMVNATEMAKVFGKRVDHFLKAEHTKKFISALKKRIEQTPNGGRSDSERPPFSGRSEMKIVEYRGHMGTYFDRRLALKFAAWLDSDFEVWVFSTLDEIMFGHYKEHWQAHTRQEAARVKMEALKEKMLLSPTPEIVASYFEAEREFNSAKNEKTRAIRNQLNLFNKENL